MLKTIITLTLATLSAIPVNAAEDVPGCIGGLFQDNKKISEILKLEIHKSNSKVPFSKALIVRDEFDGTEVAMVRDHYYEPDALNNRQVGVISSWGLRSIHFAAYFANRAGNVQFSAVSATIKVGEDLYKLDSKNGSMFAINPGMYSKIQGRPVTVRLTLDNGKIITYPIGQKTTQEWDSMVALACP